MKQPYNYQFVKGILYRIDNSLTHHDLRIYAPESCIITREDNLTLKLRIQLMYEYHEIMSAGHAGVARSFFHIQIFLEAVIET